jgi:hypothetical protein
MAKSEIWKVQRAITSSEEQPPILIYNKDRSKQGEIPATPEILDLFDDDEYKIFIQGTIGDDGQIEFEKHVDEKDW